MVAFQLYWWMKTSGTTTCIIADTSGHLNITIMILYNLMVIMQNVTLLNKKYIQSFQNKGNVYTQTFMIFISMESVLLFNITSKIKQFPIRYENKQQQKKQQYTSIGLVTKQLTYINTTISHCDLEILFMILSNCKRETTI